VGKASVFPFAESSVAGMAILESLTPPPFNWFQFVMLYLVFLELILLLLPRKIGKRILQTLFPILRRYL
jgi:hypothetical protein